MKQRIESVNWRTRQEKIPRQRHKMKRDSERMKRVREWQGNMKSNNIHVVGIPEGEEEQGIKTY